jgi:hypothetical protein
MIAPRQERERRKTGELANTSNKWIAWTSAALVASLVHVLVDFHIVLYSETSSRMSSLQVAYLFFASLIYGWWIYAATVASFTQRISDYDRKLETIPKERYPETELLGQVEGIGPLTALTFMLTLEDPSRFEKSRAV